MAFSLGLINVISGQKFQDNIGNGPLVANVVLYNESNFALQVALGSNASPLWLPAWTGDKFSVGPRGTFDGNLIITNQMISTSANPPSSAVLGNVYAEGETVPGVYPIALARQTNIGNQVATTSSDSVINDGNVAPTQVVEATPSGAGSSQLKLNNDGSAILGGGLVVMNASGVFTAIPANSIPGTAISGSVANATNAGNANTLGNGIGGYDNSSFSVSVLQSSQTSSARSVMIVSYSSGGTAHNAFTVGSAFAPNSATNVFDNGGLHVNGPNVLSGTGSGTYSHSLGVTPAWAGITTSTSGSTMTVGVDSYGSSTIHVVCGASFAFKALVI